MDGSHINNVAFHTPVLDNTVLRLLTATLSKDHTRNTAKKCKKDTQLKDREPQKSYLIPQRVPI